jgi:hypothetical protein
MKRERAEVSLEKELDTRQIAAITDAAKQLLDIIEIEEYELADWKRQTNGDVAQPAL